MFLDTSTVAELCGITERAVQKNVNNGKYGQVKYEKGLGRGGQVMKINLNNLPEEAIAKYYMKYERGSDEIETSSEYSLTDFSDQERIEAVKKKDMLEDTEKFIKQLMTDKGLGKTEATKQACEIVRMMNEDMPYSVATYYRYKDAYESDGLPGLVDKRGYDPIDADHEGNYPPAKSINHEAWDFFKGIFLTQQKRAVKTCYDILKLMAKKEGWTIPTRRTIARYVKDRRYINPMELTLKREGNKAFFDKYADFVMRDVTALKSNDIWIGDHHQLDILAKDDQGNINAPWLSAWLDARSGKFVGYTLTFNPNLDTVTESFANGCMEYGIPECIYIDNGKDYRAYSFAGGRPTTVKKSIELMPDEGVQMVKQLDVEVIFATPYNARAKAIERKFLDVKNQFSKWFKTYRGGNVIERPEELTDIVKNKDNLITLDELKEKFHKWLTTIFHKMSKHGQGMDGKCSDVVYAENMGIPRKISKAEISFMLTRVKGTRTVGRNGIKVFKAYYDSPELYKLRDQKVIVRYDNNDLGEIFVCDLEGKLICTATVKGKAAYIGASEKVFKQLKSKNKKLREIAEGNSKIQYSDFDIDDLLELSDQIETEEVEMTNVLEVYKSQQYEALKEVKENKKKQKATVTDNENVANLMDAYNKKADEDKERKARQKELLENFKKAYAQDI